MKSKPGIHLRRTQTVLSLLSSQKIKIAHRVEGNTIITFIYSILFYWLCKETHRISSVKCFVDPSYCKWRKHQNFQVFRFYFPTEALAKYLKHSAHQSRALEIQWQELFPNKHESLASLENWKLGRLKNILTKERHSTLYFWWTSMTDLDIFAVLNAKYIFGSGCNKKSLLRCCWSC